MPGLLILLSRGFKHAEKYSQVRKLLADIPYLKRRKTWPRRVTVGQADGLLPGLPQNVQDWANDSLCEPQFSLLHDLCSEEPELSTKRSALGAPQIFIATAPNIPALALNVF